LGEAIYRDCDQREMGVMDATAECARHSQTGGSLAEKEAEEKLMKQVQADMMRNLLGSLPTLPRPDPSTYDPTR